MCGGATVGGVKVCMGDGLPVGRGRGVWGAGVEGAWGGEAVSLLPLVAGVGPAQEGRRPGHGWGGRGCGRRARWGGGGGGGQGGVRASHHR